MVESVLASLCRRAWRRRAHPRRLVRTTPLLLLCLALAACSSSPSHPTRSEVTGSQQERVTRASAILAKYLSLPGLLLDAHLAEDVQDNSSGMVPGPSDSWLSGVLVVPAADLPLWRTALAPVLSPAPSPAFTSPVAPPAWWPADAAFSDCEFYAPKKLTGRSGGFVAVSPSAAAIYFSVIKL